MADTFKLRLKVGVHEFDAEGPKDEVNARFEAWKAMIEAQRPAPRPAQSPDIFAEMFANMKPSASPSADADAPLIPDHIMRVFAWDERRSIVSLRIQPSGENREADAVLLLLYGYLGMKGMDEVRVTKLTQSMQVSGMRNERIDRSAAIHVRANLLFKHGAGKGGRYALTTVGRSRAQALAEELYSTVA